MNQSEKEILLGRLQELEDESRLITTKIQAIKIVVGELEFKEATLFDHVEDNHILVPAESGIPAEDAPRRPRARTKDGTMTAEMISNRLTKELGREITTESVIRVGKTIKAKPVYSTRQHVSRYSPEEANTIMNLYRSFNQL